MPGVSDVVIADRLSDANQVRIRGTTGLQVSWELSRAGMLAFDLPLTDLRSYGYATPLSLLSKWLHYEHPTAGHWGGVITNVNPSNGIVSIGAESWAACLRGVGTRAFGKKKYGLVTMLMQQIDAVRGITGIKTGTVDVGGRGDLVIRDDPIEAGIDIYDSYLPSVLDEWNATKGWRPTLQAAGWNVDPQTRRLSFDATYGQDLSGSVAIRAKRHITSADVAEDATDIINTVYISGKVNYRYSETVKFLNEQGKRTKKQITRVGVKDETAVGRNASSIARHGEKSVLLNEDYPSKAAMQEGAAIRANTLTLNTQQVSIETADVDGVWQYLREGNLVAVVLANEGVSGTMVIRNRALDVGRGVMVIAGEALLS